MERRCILAVFAHPDDETSAAGATRGELGTLSTGGITLSREELPFVRETEIRSVMRLYGVRPPLFVGYRDQQVQGADFETLAGKVKSIMDELRPDAVITFGPTGISRHPDHMAVHRTAVEAFHRYRKSVSPEPRLFYVAIPKGMADRFELDIDGPETQPTHFIPLAEQWPVAKQWPIAKASIG